MSSKRKSLLRVGRPWIRAVAAGLALAGSLPPWGFWPLGFVGMALWVELLADEPAGTRAVLSGLVSASWLAPATIWMVDLTLVGWPVAVLGFALMHAAAGMLTPSDQRRRLAFPAAFALAELLRWSWPFGGVPLATMAMAQVSSDLAHTVRLGGPLLLSVLTVVGGVTLAAIFSLELKVVLAGVAVSTLAGLAASAAPGAQAVRTAEIGAQGASVGVEGTSVGDGDGDSEGTSVGDGDGDSDTNASIVVAAVQGGGPQNTRADVCEQRAVFERHLRTTRDEVRRPVDLIVWPEDVVHASPDSARAPGRCAQPLLGRSEALAELSALAREFDAVLVAGLFERSDDGEANRNYVAAFDAQGALVDTYDKVRLVPFGEFVPLRSTVERFSDELPARDVRPGDADEPAVLATPLGPLGVSISWEIFFEHRARDAIGDGRGQLLLNPTNGSSYWLTVVQSQQIASSRLRAIETDRWVVQAAPTGFSAVISPDGTVIARTGVSESKVVQETVGLRAGDTLAVRLGAWPVAAASALTLSLALGSGRVFTRRKPRRKP